MFLYIMSHLMVRKWPCLLLQTVPPRFRGNRRKGQGGRCSEGAKKQRPVLEEKLNDTMIDHYII